METPICNACGMVDTYLSTSDNCICTECGTIDDFRWEDDEPLPNKQVPVIYSGVYGPLAIMLPQKALDHAGIFNPFNPIFRKEIRESEKDAVRRARIYNSANITSNQNGEV